MSDEEYVDLMRRRYGFDWERAARSPRA
jgi:hypothetical protein